MKTKARLFTAYEWVCDECGEKNFCSAVHAEMPPEEREEMFRHAFDLDEFQEVDPELMGVDLVTAPEDVTCTRCGTEFEAERENYEEGEDEED